MSKIAGTSELPQWDFMVLLSQDRADSERLEAFLSNRFPEYKFGVGTDSECETDYAVLACPSIEGLKDGHFDFRLSPSMGRYVISEISRAVAAFASGHLGRPH